MAIQLKSTKGGGNSGVKILAYGESGAGKTLAISTLKNPFILSTEKGLLSLSEFDFPYETIDSMEKMQEVYEFLTQDETGKSFTDIALDSITDIAEVCLNAEKKATKDPRQAYGTANDKMGELIRLFRDLQDRNIYFTAQLDKVQDEKGRLLYGPSMPGKTLTQQLPFFFDIVLAFRVEAGEDGKPIYAVQTQTDGLWQAKNRGGKLDMWEAPDLGAIIEKVRG